MINSVKPKKVVRASDIVRQNKKVLSAAETTGLREFLKLQRDFKRQQLTRLMFGSELKEIRRQLTGKPENITMLWYGIPFTQELLSMEHQLKQHAYFELLTEETRMKVGLEAAGYTLKDFGVLMKTNTFKKKFKKVELPDYLG